MLNPCLDLGLSVCYQRSGVFRKSKLEILMCFANVSSICHSLSRISLRTFFCPKMSANIYGSRPHNPLSGFLHDQFKAGVHLKAVFTPLKKIMEISRSRFKQDKNPMLKTQINVLGVL